MRLRVNIWLTIRHVRTAWVSCVYIDRRRQVLEDKKFLMHPGEVFTVFKFCKIVLRSDRRNT